MNLVRNLLTVGSNTLPSRVLGFVREVLIAATLGAGPVADAFYAAFRFPNLFRRLFAEGAFNSAFIPLFAKELEGGGTEAARRFASEVLAALFAILLLFTAIVELVAPIFVISVIAPGFADDPQKFDLTVILTRVMFPYLAFMSLVAMLSGVLNALHRYFAAAFAPILLNIVLITVLAVGRAAGLERADIGQIMAAGVFVAGLGQLLLLIIAVRRAGFTLRLARPRLTPGVRRLLVLAAPAAIAGGITQINLFVGQIIASQKDGAIAVLQYADRVYQLPLGVVGIAIGVVLLPELSRALKAERLAECAYLQNRALEFALFLTLPAAAALAVMPEAVVRVLYERGAFGTETTAAAAGALALFAVGLPAFVLVKVFSPGFFAREDTRTPMRIAALAMAVNIALSLALFPTMGEAGIALATTTAGWVNAAFLCGVLVRRGHWAFEPVAVRRSAMMLGSSLVMAVVIGLAIFAGDAYFRPTAGIATQAGALAAVVILGAAVYFAAVQLSGAADIRILLGFMRRR